MKNSFKQIEHSADIGFEIKAENQKCGFQLACKALTDYMYKKRIVKEKYNIDFNIKNDNLKDIFIDFLEEIIFNFDAKNFITISVIFDKINNQECKGKFIGYSFDNDYDELHTYIKAITYYQLDVKSNENNFYAKFFIDV